LRGVGIFAFMRRHRARERSSETKSSPSVLGKALTACNFAFFVWGVNGLSSAGAQTALSFLPIDIPPTFWERRWRL
jgi:hypothetical protein